MQAENHHRMLKERQRQERAAFILQTAEEVLLQKGHAAMSMDDIAARTGIAKGTLYLHFATTDELVFRLYLLYNSTELKNAMREKLGGALHGVAERITALLEEGKAGGEFDPAIPTDVMASIYSACSHRGPSSTW